MKRKLIIHLGEGVQEMAAMLHIVLTIERYRSGDCSLFHFLGGVWLQFSKTTETTDTVKIWKEVRDGS